MGIGKKVILSSMILVLISVGLIFFSGSTIWNYGYLELERKQVRDHVARTQQVWDAEVDTMAAVVDDWAHWDELYEFAWHPENRDFLRKNLTNEYMANLKLNMLFVLSSEGDILFGRSIDSNTGRTTVMPPMMVEHLTRLNALLPPGSIKKNSMHGFIMLEEYPAFVAVQRITTSDFKGESPGMLVFIRNIDERYMETLCERLQAKLMFMNNPAFAFRKSMAGQEILDDERIVGYKELKDIYGNSGYLLSVEMERDIFKQGQQQMQKFATVVLVLGLLLSVATTFVLEKVVLHRLRRLDLFMKNVAASDDDGMRLSLKGGDELSRTAETMNQMLDRLQESRYRLSYLSLHDRLTGLYNRSYFEQMMDTLGERNLKSIGIVSCDVDGLKIVNDTLGHAAGDEMLLQAVKILNEVFAGRGDIIRMGGDEFIVLLPDATSEELSETCLDITARLQEVRVGQEGFNLRMSLGWECRTEAPINGETVTALIRQADDAMYRKKLASSFANKQTMMRQIVKMLDRRDYINEGHGERVAAMSEKLGQDLELASEQLHKLRLLGQFHDIGKVGIADSIVFKQGELDALERSEMERHAEVGYRIALAIPELNEIADLILKHHERYDGTGYPIGLKEREIPLEDRILAIVDTYDEMTSHRPYRKAVDKDKALQEIKRCSGSQFDPELVELFIRQMQ